MKAELFGKIEFPSDMQKEQSISQIISQGIRKPQKLSCALWEVWNTAGYGESVLEYGTACSWLCC